MRRRLRPCRGPWRGDETCVRVDGEWRHLCRAVDGTGQAVNFLLGARRDEKAAERFFREAPGRADVRDPREVVTDRLASHPGAPREMKREGELWRSTRHRRGRRHGGMVGQDHRRIKRRTGPVPGFGGFRTARRPGRGGGAGDARRGPGACRAEGRRAGPAGLCTPALRACRLGGPALARGQPTQRNRAEHRGRRPGGRRLHEGSGTGRATRPRRLSARPRPAPCGAGGRGPARPSRSRAAPAAPARAPAG